ncbi:MAG: hypothetical protein R3B13_01725 [Polyangiaceae bacterium]
MATTATYDAAHFAFLELIRSLNDLAGPAATKIAMLRLGQKAAAEVPQQSFDTVEEFIASLQDASNPISQFEGAAKHYGEGVFGLHRCPFAPSIATYQKIKGELPSEYKEITSILNRPGAGGDALRVGEGAAVSPFCGVHQPIRSAMGSRISIGGHPLKIYQLGCKSAGGHKGFADRWIEETGVERGLVDRILDENMCCYCFKLEE